MYHITEAEFKVKRLKRLPEVFCLPTFFSTPDKLNTAIGQTNKTYTLGPIKFGTNKAAVIPAIMLQWQNNDTVQVYPKISGATFEAPLKGLA